MTVLSFFDVLQVAKAGMNPVQSTPSKKDAPSRKPSEMSTQRSKSVPAIRNADRAVDEENHQNEAARPFPNVSMEPPREPTNVPSWIQELADPRPGRSSRASSIVSTRTRLSTTTFDDARSIDIQAGGQTFRIGRFGDRVTDTTAPPPYTGPVDDETFPPHFGEHQHFERRGPPFDKFEEYMRRRRHLFGGPGRMSHPRRVRIAMPHDEVDGAANGDETMAADTPSRIVTDQELRQVILDLPARLCMALGINPERTPPPVTDSVNTNTTAGTNDSDNVQQNQASDSVEASTEPPLEKNRNSVQMRGILRNAPQSSLRHDITRQPEDDTSTMDSTTVRLWNTYQNSRQAESPQFTAIDTLDNHEQQSETSFPLRNNDLSPTVGDLNELSQVYNRVIRDLDREHRKQLHARDKELDQLRILLHEKDTVYRQQLKGRDFIIEDLRQRQSRLEETIEARIERAAHEVEDLWETRWKEHSKQLMIQCGLTKPDPDTNQQVATKTDD